MITDFKSVKGQILYDMIDWIEKYQADNHLAERRAESGGVLSGEALEDFIGALQSKMVESVTKYAGGFGENTIGDSATLVLYSGVSPQMVEDFCNQSGGKYYMISQTGADVLWNEDLREKIAETIGEDKPTEPISARVLEGKEGKYGLKKGDLRFRLENDAKYATDSHRFLALDDFISQKVAEAGVEKGKIHYFLANSHSGIPRSVGMLTEIPYTFNSVWQHPDAIDEVLELDTNLGLNENGVFVFEKKEMDAAKIYVGDSDKIVYADLIRCVDEKADNIKPPVEYKEVLSLKDFLKKAKEKIAKELDSVRSTIIHPSLPTRKHYIPPEAELLQTLQKMDGQSAEQMVMTPEQQTEVQEVTDKPSLHKTMEAWKKEISAVKRQEQPSDKGQGKTNISKGDER